MQILQITNVPNQTFTTNLNNTRYQFAIYNCNGIMCCDIAIADIWVVTGSRITNGTFLIPFYALTQNNGNFLLLTQNEDLPNFNKFGLTQTLVYLTDLEIRAAVQANFAVYVMPARFALS